MIVSMRLAVFASDPRQPAVFRLGARLPWHAGQARRAPPRAAIASPDQVRVVSRGRAAAPASREAGGSAAESKDAASCQLWSDLASAEADQIERLLGEQFADFKATRRTVAENSGYWVFVHALANKEEVSKKTAELQQLGVQDFSSSRPAAPTSWPFRSAPTAPRRRPTQGWKPCVRKGSNLPEWPSARAETGPHPRNPGP
jgi:hypothetical protein